MSILPFIFTHLMAMVKKSIMGNGGLADLPIMLFDV
jgi:hypothetical protein